MGFLSGLSRAAGIASPILGAIGALQGARGRNNPANAAGGYLGQLPGYGRDAYNPFIERGNTAWQTSNPIISGMAQNPVGHYNQILGQYQPSQGYQYRQDRLTQGLHNTAAAGGFAGTKNHQEAYGELVNSLMGNDMQQFLQNILGIQGAGLGGLDNDVGRGFQASTGLADYLGNAAGAQAGIAGAGTNYRNAGRENVYSSLASLIGTRPNAGTGARTGGAGGWFG